MVLRDTWKVSAISATVYRLLPSAVFSSYICRAIAFCRVLSLGASTGTASDPGGLQAFEGAFANQIGEHLIHCPDDVEQEPSGGVVVSMPCLTTMRSTPRSCRSAAISVRCRTERAIRDRQVMTSSSPGRR